MRTRFAILHRQQLEADEALAAFQRTAQRALPEPRATHHHAQQGAVRILHQALPHERVAAAADQPADLDEQALALQRERLDFQLDHQAPLYSMPVSWIVPLMLRHATAGGAPAANDKPRRGGACRAGHAGDQRRIEAGSCLAFSAAHSSIDSLVCASPRAMPAASLRRGLKNACRRCASAVEQPPPAASSGR